MSSLTERLTQAQSEAAKKSAEEEAIRVSSEQIARQAAQQVVIEAQKKVQEAVRQEQGRVAILIAKLSPLLDTIGARDQLEEVRGIWKIGTIDPAPQLLSESPTPSIGLALRHKFVDVEPNLRQTMVADGEDPWVHYSSGLHLREVVLFVITGQGENRPTIQTSYGLRSLTYANFTSSAGQGIKGGEYHNLNPGFHNIAVAGPEQFQIADPENARSLLENQLFGVLQRASQPLQMQENARVKIARDQFTSLPPAQSYYRSLMKSIRDVQPETSVPWYKRLLT